MTHTRHAPITAICIRELNGNSVVFGCGDYDCPENVRYIKCAEEKDLCKQFLRHWQQDYPDIISEGIQTSLIYLISSIVFVCYLVKSMQRNFHFK